MPVTRRLRADTVLRILAIALDERGDPATRKIAQAKLAEIAHRQWRSSPPRKPDPDPDRPLPKWKRRAAYLNDHPGRR
jgi:hypothetical protein